MRRTSEMKARILAAALLVCLTATAWAGSYTEAGVPYDDPSIVAWATGYSDYVRSDDDTSYCDPNEALGTAGDSVYDVVSLGDVNPADDSVAPGTITLTFDVTIADGPGADLAVFENPFGNEYPTSVFAEFAFVEVSTDGTTFARFPAISDIPEMSGAFNFIDVSDCYNLAGKQLVGVGGPFDLAELADEPEVQNGYVDLSDINYVRIVDIPGYGTRFTGQDGYTDSRGLPIYDNWPTASSGGFDLDGVAVLNTAGGDDDDDDSGSDPDSIEIYPGSLNLLAGEQYRLFAREHFSDESTDDDVAVDWSSDTPGVATIDDDGIVTAVAAGTATITAEETGSGLTDSIDVTVGADVLVVNGLAQDLFGFNSTTDELYRFTSVDIGTSPNTLAIRGGDAYVVASLDDAITVLNTKSLETDRVFDLTGVSDNPWDIEFVSDSKAYVSGWLSDNVAILDPQTGTVTGTIDFPTQTLPLGPSGMEVVGDKLFVACNNRDAFVYPATPESEGNGLVYVVDLTTDTLIDTDGDAGNGTTPIDTGHSNAGDIALAASGDLFVSCSGNYNYEEGTYSWLVAIDPTTYDVIDEFDLGEGSRGIVLSSAPNGKVYVGDGENPYLYSVDPPTMTLLRSYDTNPIEVPNGGTYYSYVSSKLQFRDGIAYGLEFNDNWLFAFALSADDDANPVAFSKSIELAPGSDNPGSQFLALAEEGACYPGELCVRVYLNGYYAGGQYRDGAVDIELYDAAGDTLVSYFPAVALDADGLGRADVYAEGIPDNDYRVVVRHANHLDLISVSAVNVGTLTTNRIVNFGDPGQVACGTASLIYESGSGNWSMPGGDATGDETVNIFDYANMGQQWSTAGPDSDYTGDGVVNIFDYAVLGQNWNRTGCSEVP